MEKTTGRLLCLVAGILLLGISGCNLTRPGTDGSPVAVTDIPMGPGSDPILPAGPTNTDGAETILIPGGTFWMGSQAEDTHADLDEQPSHQVMLNGYYLYTHEITNAMYADCVASGACLPVNMMDSGPTTHTEDPAYAEYPVVGVDWNMADDYCTWAGGRLPTEAEWELAARGTESLLYPWGTDEPACDRVNMFGCLVPPDTAAVGNYLLGNSPFAVWDMAGNVWEWVYDWYDPDYYALSPDFAPLGPSLPDDPNDPLKVVRGGGLFSRALTLHSASRAAADPLRAFDDVGFRCVAQSGLPLPPGYVPVREGHEMVEPDPLDGGGEPLEDPDPGIHWYAIGRALVSCPNAEGQMHIFLEVDSSEAVTYAVEVNGNPFICYYDDMLRGLQCAGPIPPDNDTLERYTIDVHFTPGGIGHFNPLVPHDCPVGVEWPFSLSATAACPGDDGLVTVAFTYDPAIAWDLTQYLEGMSYADMPCIPTSPTSMNCTLPGRAPGDFYSFALHGFDGGGGEFYLWTVAGIPADCPVGMRSVSVTAGCGEAGPVAEVMYLPTTAHLASVSTIGVPLPCIGMAPGVQVCGPLPGTPGSGTTITTCFEGEACTDWPLTIADCPGETSYSYILEPACYPAGTPAGSLHYWPFDQPLLSVESAAVALTCEDWGGGWYMCPDLPGDPGTNLTFSFELPDGTWVTSVITVPDCVGFPPPEEGEAWRVAAVGCHDETRIYFIVDTAYDWLVPGAGFTYTATDEVGSYTCEVHPTIPGRLYCAGPRPETPGTLQLCIQPDGGSLVCNDYAEFPTWVDLLPDCAEAPEEPHIPSCADYTIDTVCAGEHKGECVWDYDLHVCHDYP